MFEHPIYLDRLALIKALSIIIKAKVNGDVYFEVKDSKLTLITLSKALGVTVTINHGQAGYDCLNRNTVLSKDDVKRLVKYLKGESDTFVEMVFDEARSKFIINEFSADFLTKQFYDYSVICVLADFSYYDDPTPQIYVPDVPNAYIEFFKPFDKSAKKGCQYTLSNLQVMVTTPT